MVKRTLRCPHGIGMVPPLHLTNMQHAVRVCGVMYYIKSFTKVVQPWGRSGVHLDPVVRRVSTPALTNMDENENY